MAINYGAFSVFKTGYFCFVFIIQYIDVKL